MASATKSITLPATPERVWETVTNPELFGSWMAGHAGFSGPVPGSLEPGATFVQQLLVMGMPAQVSWRVAELDAGRHLLLEGAGPMGTKTRAGLDLEPAADGVTVNFTSAIEGDVTVAMAGPIGMELTKNVEQSLEKLRGLIEA